MWPEAVPLGVEAGTGPGDAASRDVMSGPRIGAGAQIAAVVHGSVDGLADVQARVLPVDGPASRYRLARGAP